jgi:hypothetical protein
MATVKGTEFWVVTPCISGTARRFGVTYKDLSELQGVTTPYSPKSLSNGRNAMRWENYEQQNRQIFSN